MLISRRWIWSTFRNKFTKTLKCLYFVGFFESLNYHHYAYLPHFNINVDRIPKCFVNKIFICDVVAEIKTASSFDLCTIKARSSACCVILSLSFLLSPSLLLALPLPTAVRERCVGSIVIGIDVPLSETCKSHLKSAWWRTVGKSVGCLLFYTLSLSLLLSIYLSHSTPLSVVPVGSPSPAPFLYSLSFFSPSLLHRGSPRSAT